MMIYLDNAATTRPLPELLNKVSSCLREDFANPSSIHPLGVSVQTRINDSREILADIFQLPSQSIIFCSGGSESVNLALKGCFTEKMDFSGNLVTSPLEHAAVLKSVNWLKMQGLEVRFAPIDTQTGQINLEQLKELIDRDTRLVSIQHVNSETGVVQDLIAIGNLIKAINQNLIFHSDGVQGFTKKKLNLKQAKLDLYTISGHKIHGIKGAGALIISQKCILSPQIHGGGQEYGLRAGTENVAAIMALGKAALEATRNQIENYQKVTEFNLWLRKQIEEYLPSLKILNFPEMVPHIISLSSKQIPGEVILHHLAKKQIYLSTGSACSANSKRLSTTLKALGLSPQSIRGTIRLSLAAIELPENREPFWKDFVGIIKELEKMM
jgi:cysteine desulfurase